MKKFLPTIALAAIATLAATAANTETIQTNEVAVEASVVADGLDHPWGIEVLPDGALLVTERSGTLRIVENGKVSAPVTGLPKILPVGQGGLLDIALANDFASSGTIFFSFSQPGDGGAGTALARASLDRSSGKPALRDTKILFSMDRKTRKGQHFGSRIVVHPKDGSLFFTIGDRGDGDRAQDLSDHAGAVLHINADGSIPGDNPYANGGGKPEIWSKGHRNPQGAAWDPVTKSVWTTEHGARGGDEVNRPEAGKNYGWPQISYGRHYTGFKIGVGTEAPGYEQPLWYWDPSIAPSGLDVYSGAMFPEWQGDLLAGALKFQLVARLKRDAKGTITGEERMFSGKFGRIRDVRVAPDGSVYLLTDDDDGKIIRLTRAGS